VRALVTGSAGHLGEALAVTLVARGEEVVGVDRLASQCTTHLGSITDRAFVERCMAGVETVFHAATLHKPHIASHPREAFVDCNVTGTRVLLEAARSAGVGVFVFTSTTSVFGEAMRPAPGERAVWVTEDLPARPRNIYGATKAQAETLCRLAHRKGGMRCVVLRTARFFPEADDEADVRLWYGDDNAKVNEFLYRRVDLEDAVAAHLLAAEKAAKIGFETFIISATTPFAPEDAGELMRDAPAVVSRRAPGWEALYARLGWRLFPVIGRVYVNEKARRKLGWRPRHDFFSVTARLRAGGSPRSELAARVGSKGYHREPQAKDSVIAE
jgi:nucleoside-diphosphate-sugar epimerase